MNRRILNYGLLMVMSLLLTGCPDDGNDAKDDVIVSSERIELNPTSLEFSSARGIQQTVALKANCKWNITNIPNWLIVNPKEGSGDASIVLETASDNTGNERSEQLKISGMERSVTMTVRQRSGGGGGTTPTQHTLTIDTSALTFGASATQQTVVVTSTDSWTATSDQPLWCSVTPTQANSTDRILTVKVTAYTGTNARTAKVTVRNGYSTDRVISIVQNPSSAPTLETSISAMAFDYDDTSSKTFIATVSPSTATVTAQSSNTALCTVSVIGSDSVRTIIVTPKVNTSSMQRSATISVTVTANGKSTTKTVLVSQSGQPEATLTVTSPAAFSSSGGSDYITVKSSSSWTATVENSSWLTLSSYSGSANLSGTQVLLYAEKNTTSSQRSCTVRFTSGSLTRTITVTQLASTGNLPVISSFSVYEPTSSSFKFSMTFTSDPASTNYGVCYSRTNSVPTLSDNYTYWKTSSTGRTLNGTVNHNVLEAGKTYYVRAFVVNSNGTTYSSNVLTVTLTSETSNIPGSGDNPVPNIPSRSVK